MTQLPIPVQVGSEPPDHWDGIERRQRQDSGGALSYLRKKERPSVARPDINWRAWGLDPRWIGFETVDCAAALQPGTFSGQGADEFFRFRQGAEQRGETALVISPIGEIEGEFRGGYNVFGSSVSSVSIGRTHTSINGRMIGKGAQVRIAPNLGDADGQLALRLLNCKAVARWRSLSLTGAVSESVYGREEHDPEGTLLPILETELGEPVVAAWLSPDGVERRYVLPAEAPWTMVLPWLLEQALPEFVPGALRRARRLLDSEEGLSTRREREVRAELIALNVDYRSRLSELQRHLEEAQSAVAATREGLLYGTGARLVDAVRSVFEYAGIQVVDLDDEFGDTKNADLLCTYGAMSRLVEVKSATGSASERAYQDMLRHLREWPSLPGATPVAGGALVISHDLRKVPLERNPAPYSRPEFLSAHTEPVISALELFSAWREEDVGAIRQLLFISGTASVAQAAGAEDTGTREVDTATASRNRRPWFRRR